jgi:hypothetical protein
VLGVEAEEKKQSVKQSFLEVLKANLTIEVEEGGFTDPNDGEVVCSTRININIKTRREYG